MPTADSVLDRFTATCRAACPGRRATTTTRLLWHRCAVHAQTVPYEPRVAGKAIASNVAQQPRRVGLPFGHAGPAHLLLRG